jgi:hypothetical protein
MGRPGTSPRALELAPHHQPPTHQRQPDTLQDSNFRKVMRPYSLLLARCDAIVEGLVRQLSSARPRSHRPHPQAIRRPEAARRLVLSRFAHKAKTRLNLPKILRSVVGPFDAGSGHDPHVPGAVVRRGRHRDRRVLATALPLGVHDARGATERRPPAVQSVASSARQPFATSSLRRRAAWHTRSPSAPRRSPQRASQPGS